MKHSVVIVFSFALLVFSIEARADNVVFDSFTPPSTWGGFSSANCGDVIQITSERELTISGISVLNEMFLSGSLRFAILSHPDHEFLFLSEPKAFPVDLPNQTTWKQSDPFEFAFEPETQYLVGYIRNVDVNDVGDRIAESAGGISSDLNIHGLYDFDNPTYSHLCMIGGEFAVRLHAVPEPSVFASLFTLFIFLRIRTRFGM